MDDRIKQTIQCVRAGPIAQVDQALVMAILADEVDRLNKLLDMVTEKTGDEVSMA